MEDFKFDDTGNLTIFASHNSSQNDFDFYIGKWNIKNRKRKERLANSEEWIEFDSTDEASSLLGGLGNMNKFNAVFDNGSFEGISIRLFNPKTKLWSIYWADTNTGYFDPPMVGSFDGNIGKLYCMDKHKGKDVLVQFHWDKSDNDKPVWSQAFSPDLGKNWEWDWYMYCTRIKE